MNVKQILPQRIHSARKSLNMTQAELAQKTGMSQHWISHLECGRRLPAADTLLKLCDALACSADYLLGRFEIKPKKGK